MTCICGQKTGTHTDDAAEPASGLCTQCLEAGCDPDNQEVGCLAEETGDSFDPPCGGCGECDDCKDLAQDEGGDLPRD